MMSRRLTVLVSLCCLVGVSGCDGEEDGASTPSGETTQAATDEASASSAAEASGGEIAVLEPVPCEDATREPTELESTLLIEAGPYSGDSFDAEAAAEAVLAMDPQTEDEWVRAVASQVQGDHAAAMCELISFSPDLGDTAAPTAGPPETAAVGQNHFALVLDASGSMAAQSSGGTRMDDAKSAIEDFTDALPAGSTVSLRIYGHEGSNSEADRAESCESSEVVYEGALGEGFSEALGQVQPVGWTPLARAIGDTEGDIDQDATDAIVYVVTDGIETCEGNPVAAAGALAEAGIQPVVNVIGFQVGDADQEALAAIADAGGGAYTQADSAAALEEYWKEEASRLSRAWTEWQDAESYRLDDARADLQERNREVYQDLRGELSDDLLNSSQVARELRDADAFGDDAQSQEMIDLIKGYFDERYDYVQDLGHQNSETVSSLFTDQMADLYSESTSTWSELYEESLQDD